MNSLQRGYATVRKAWQAMTSFRSLICESQPPLKAGTAQRTYESLEGREMLSVNFQFNYSLDTNNFFSSQTRKDMLVYAGKLVGQRLSDSLSAITPSGSNSWSAT